MGSDGIATCKGWLDEEEWLAPLGGVKLPLQMAEASEVGPFDTLPALLPPSLVEKQPSTQY